MRTDVLDSMEWGGSGIERFLFDFIVAKVPPGSKVLEIGAGICSTNAFSVTYDLTTVEQNQQYVGHFDCKYIYAPIVDGWYDTEILKQELPADYDLIFIDGPAGEGNRWGFLENLDLFDTSKPMIFHDTYRDEERRLAQSVADKLGKPIVFNDHIDYWAVVGEFASGNQEPDA